MKKYIIRCLEGYPLSSWSEPDTLENILERYREQANEELGEEISKEKFTAELFEELWNCELVEVKE